MQSEPHRHRENLFAAQISVPQRPGGSEYSRGKHFSLAILRVLMYQILSLLREPELSEQYGQQGEA